MHTCCPLLNRNEGSLAVNKRKVLDAARKYAQKGAKQKALREYSMLLKLDPRDAKLRLEVGDAHRRWNENEEAIGHYHKVADQYQQDGFDARAVAVQKQILNLDPKRYAAYVALSDLYQSMGLDAEAVGALQTAADGYNREGKKHEALELLRKMSQLDPGNTTSRLKVAELLQQEGLEQDAAEEFQGVAEELARQGEMSEAEKIYEQLVDLCPERTEILLVMARNAIAMGGPERAEAWAKRAVEQEPTEAAFEVLCDVFKALERTEELIDATKALARLYRDHGDEDTARTIMQRLPSEHVPDETSEVLDPSDMHETIDEASIGDAEDSSDAAVLADDGTGVFESGGQDLGEAEDLADVDEFEVSLAVEEGEDLNEVSGELVLPEGDPDQLLAEASVYLRYGKTDHAIASLRAVLADEAGHRGALEKLGEALVASSDPTGAVEMWSKAAECAREEDDFDGFAVVCERIRTLDPQAADALGEAQPEVPVEKPPVGDEVVLDTNEALFADPDVSNSSTSERAQAEEVEIDIDIDLEGDVDNASSFEGDVSDTFAVAELSASSSAGSSCSETTAQQVQGELEEAEFYFAQGMFDEAGEAYERVLQVAQNHPSALLRIGEIAALRGNDPTAAVAMTDDEAATIRTDDGVEAGTQGGDPTPTPVDPDAEFSFEIVSMDASSKVDLEVDLHGDLPADVSDVADVSVDDAAAHDFSPSDSESDSESEVDSRIDFEIDVEIDDATFEVGAEELTEVPVEVRPEESEPTAAAELEAEPIAAAGQEHADESFDLAAELSDAFGDDDTENASSIDGALQGTEEEAFANLFDDFKRGVSATLEDGDYETRYDLAIAYKEMGLVEDAISAFQVCVSCPKRGLDSLQLMAQCQLDAGRVTDAIGHLEQALSTDGLTAERRAGVYFDLGRAFAASGDYARARTNFETVSELDPSFPGVAEAVVDLLERMGGPVEGDDLDEDEAFENFDDVVAEATAEAAVVALNSESAEDPLAAAQEAQTQAPKRKKNKKKISFV